MQPQIPENWLEQIDEADYLEAVIRETEAMIMSLSVYFNINKPDQDNVKTALKGRLNKSTKEILEILNAFVQFKAKILLFDCFYGDQFLRNDEDDLILTPDVLEQVYGSTDHAELVLIRKSQQEFRDAALDIAWMNIRFEFLS